MAREFSSPSSQYMSHGAALAGPHPCTFACWFNASTGASGATLMCVSNNSVVLQYLRMQLSSSRIFVESNSSQAFSGAYTAIWNHAVGRWSAANSRSAFLNGVKGTDSTTSVTPTGLNTTAIGARITTSVSAFMQGRIAEAAIWNVGLTDAEVAALYRSNPLMIRPDALVGYWPLLGRNDPEIDVVGGFNMTLTNAPTYADHPRRFWNTGALLLGAPSTAGGGAYTLTAAQGSFALSGQSTALKAGRLLDNGAGAFALSGQTAALSKGYALAAAQGSFALQGQSAALSSERQLTCSAGTFASTGQSVDLTAQRRSTASHGAFAIQGQTAGLAAARRLTAAAGAFSHEGQPAQLATARALDAQRGLFSLTGLAGGLVAGRILLAGVGQLLSTGQAASLRAARSFASDVGLYTVSGQPAALGAWRNLAAEAGAFAFAGQSAELIYEGGASPLFYRRFVLSRRG